MSHRYLFCICLVMLIPATASADTLGYWCDTMVPSLSRYDSVIEISSTPDNQFRIITQHADGSQSERALVKSASKFIVEDNRFGTYYEIRGDGELAIFDSEGFVRTAKPVEDAAKPGACR